MKNCMIQVHLTLVLIPQLPAQNVLILDIYERGSRIGGNTLAMISRHSS